MAKINLDQPAMEKSPGKPRILVAPLDWGLGHTTRCIPVIYELLAQGADVWAAGNAVQRRLLSSEFPQLPILPLAGYDVSYAKSAAGLFIRLLLQSPRILLRIRQERRWLERTLKTHQWDGVISDNRFGLHHSSLPSVFMTHQLAPASPMGSGVDSFFQNRNYRFINRFSECWVPDDAADTGLAGKLSHPNRLPRIPLHYIGALSRLHKADHPEKKGHLFLSLSGPEPQRTLLENRIVEEISHYNGTATIVRGLPALQSLIPSTNDIRFFNHLDSAAFALEMAKAEYVICRGGYSTIMDVMAMKKKSILIPTPGQTEQEYLCRHLAERGLAASMPQKDFSLSRALQLAAHFPYSINEDKMNDGLASRITSWLNGIRGGI